MLGAAAYAMLQFPRRRARCGVHAKGGKQGLASEKAGGRRRPQQPSVLQRARAANEPPERKASVAPISAPLFQAAELRDQVDELLAQVSPTAESDRAVRGIANLAQELVRALIPEAEVVGVASSNIARGTAFGVAVPECELILQAKPAVLAARLGERLGRAGRAGDPRLDPRKLQKSALRACVELFCSKGGFKFRRSAFSGDEPKVTLLAPLGEGSDRTVPVHFSVNTITALHNAALLAECGQLEQRAKGLIVLVRRWAKDRGICHAPMGHLGPYAWSLLAIFSAQVRAQPGAAPLLPPLRGFKISSGLAARGQGPDGEAWRRPEEAVDLSVAALLLPLHIVEHGCGETEVAPNIEDPFEPARNLGATMTGHGLRRLREEFARAAALLAEGASLSSLLEPWAPPEGGAAGQPKGAGPEGVDPAAPALGGQ